MEQKKSNFQHKRFCKEHCKCINPECLERAKQNDEIRNTVLDVEYIYIEPTQNKTQDHTNQR